MLKAQIVDENGARVLESETGSVVAKVYDILMNGASVKVPSFPVNSWSAMNRFEALQRDARERAERHRQKDEELDRLREENSDLKDQLKLWQAVAKCKDKLQAESESDEVPMFKCETCRYWSQGGDLGACLNTRSILHNSGVSGNHVCGFWEGRDE